jgi:4-alpha-glucanotransferase
MPGTTDRENWSIPLPVALEDLDDQPLVRRLVEIVSRR